MSVFKRGLLKLKAQVETPAPKIIGKLAIIIGHSDADEGASGNFPVGKIQEYSFNTKEIAPVMIEEAKKLGLETKVFLRDGTDVWGVGKNVDAWADSKTVAIELHFNSTTGAAGSETLYDTTPKGNLKFARMVQDAMVSVFGRTGEPGKTGSTNRGLVLRDKGRGAHNLTAVHCVGCLVEPAFCDNKPEAKLLWDKRVEYAKALTGAAFSYIKQL